MQGPLRSELLVQTLHRSGERLAGEPEAPRGLPHGRLSRLESVFYGPVDRDLAVPEENRNWLMPGTVEEVREASIRVQENNIDTIHKGIAVNPCSTRR